MNVGIFTDTYYPEINGVANSVYQLKEELERRGNNVFIFTVSNKDMKEAETNVFRMKSIPFILLKERRVGCQSFHRWFRLIECLHLDVIHTQTEFSVGYIGRKAAGKLDIPLVHTYHTIYEDYTHYLKVPGSAKLKGMVRSLSRICCNYADEVVVPTQKVRNLLLDYGVKRDIIIQPTGISVSKFQSTKEEVIQEFRKQYQLEQEHHILLSVGRLSKEKNVMELLRIVRSIVREDPLVRMLIAGDGPEREELEAYVKENDLGNYIIFTGAVHWSIIENIYALADVFVCASTSETQGLTYSEALAAGKPLLVRHDDCQKDILNEGTNGYSYENEQEFIQYYDLLFHKEQKSVMARNIEKNTSIVSREEFGQNIEKIYQVLVRDEIRKKGCETYGEIHSIA